INAVVPEDFWESIKETMRVSFMDGYFVEGICKGVKEIGQKLKAFFPISKDDLNELSNEISIGE
ncbi:MAG: TPM domain-containing protein, partial [Bacteroidales bacterium]